MSSICLSSAPQAPPVCLKSTRRTADDLFRWFVLRRPRLGPPLPPVGDDGGFVARPRLLMDEGAGRRRLWRTQHVLQLLAEPSGLLGQLAQPRVDVSFARRRFHFCQLLMQQIGRTSPLRGESMIEATQNG